jgi:endonuclease YncB( thermonuclease family)
MVRKPPMLARHPASFADARAAGWTRGVCLHVVDGDTADFLLDLGWFQYAYVSLRLARIDAPELRRGTAAERSLAVKARRRLVALLERKPVLVASEKEASSFGRFIAHVFAPAAGDAPRQRVRRIAGTAWLDVAQVLLREGLATRAGR